MMTLETLKAELEQLKAENRRLIEEISWLPDCEYGNVLTKLDDKDLINKLETQRVANINSVASEMPFLEQECWASLDDVMCMYDQIYNMEE